MQDYNVPSIDTSFQESWILSVFSGLGFGTRSSACTTHAVRLSDDVLKALFEPVQSNEDHKCIDEDWCGYHSKEVEDNLVIW